MPPSGYQGSVDPKGAYRVARFDLLPARPPIFDVGALASFVVHAAIVVVVATNSLRSDDRPSPIDQLVVFLAPPDRELGRRAPGTAIDWSAVVGTAGATETPLPHVDEPEQTLSIGTAGDTATTPVEPAAPAVVEETALSEIDVDSAVVRDSNSVAPAYPAKLLAKSIEGSTFVHYVVDTSGRVDVSTIQVIRTTHEEFATSVKEALASMKFQPAVQGSQRVRQWVQQSFAFRIIRPVPADTT